MVERLLSSSFILGWPVFRGSCLFQRVLAIIVHWGGVVRLWHFLSKNLSWQQKRQVTHGAEGGERRRLKFERRSFVGVLETKQRHVRHRKCRRLYIVNRGTAPQNIPCVRSKGLYNSRPYEGKPIGWPVDPYIHIHSLKLTATAFEKMESSSSRHWSSPTTGIRFREN